MVPPAGKFASTPKLLELVQHAESDAWLSMGLAFYLNVLPLSRQLASLSGALWTRVLQVGACDVGVLLFSHTARDSLQMPSLIDAGREAT